MGTGKAVKTKDGWKATLATHAEPVMGALPVQTIDTALVLKVLEPSGPRSRKWRGACANISRQCWIGARARGYREGENPARWKGHLDRLLPARGKVRQVKHHASLPYSEIGDFMRDLRAQEGVAAEALECTILCASRTGEIIGAKPGEINLAQKVWTIPAERMKPGKEHRVPLTWRGPRRHQASARHRWAIICSPAARRVSRFLTWRC